MLPFKPRWLSLALASTLGTATFGTSLALAQDAQPTPAATSSAAEQPKTDKDIEVIEVKGFRMSLQESLNSKRLADTVVEAISADDLGALPDASMADALTRLPGVSAVRTGGQAAEINIRGMGGGFVFSTLNGREQVSTSGSRSIEFDQYPSELISSAAVYKSPKASLIEGGVAGTVELKTASALDKEQQHNLTLNVRGMNNDRADEVADAQGTGHRFSFAYQGKFFDDTVGLSLGFARLYQPSVAAQFIGFAYNGKKDLDGDGDDEFISEGFEMQHKGGEETRNGYVAAVEWAPNDSFKLKADAFISKFDSKAFARGFRVKFGGTSAAYNNVQLSELGSMIGGTVNRTSNSFTRIELVNDDNQDFDEVRNFGVNAAWQLTDNFSLALDVSRSAATSDFRNGLLWSLVAKDANAAIPELDENVSLTYQLNGLAMPDVGFNQADYFTDINKVMVSKYGIYPYQNADALNAYRLDMKYVLDNPFFASIEAGLRYSDRDYRADRSVFEYGDDGAFSATEPPLRLTADMVKQVDFAGAFSHFPSYLAIDLNQALAAWFPSGIPQPMQTFGPGGPGVINGETGARNSAWSVLESGNVFETVSSAYLQLNIDTELAGLPVTGNLGMRRIDTEQRASTLTDVGGDPSKGAQYITDQAGYISNQYAPGFDGVRFTDYLPSLNVNFKLTDQDQLRFALAKVMARAPINRLASNASVRVQEVTAVQDPDTKLIALSADEAIISGSSSNSPRLQPFYANQLDLSYERYFEDGNGAFVAAVFYKDIRSFINTFTEAEFDFAGNGFDVPSSVTVNVTDPDGKPVLDSNGVQLTVEVPTKNGDYTTAINNDKGGYIRGLELAFTRNFDGLPEPFNGLGLSGSYSFTQSEIQQQTTVGQQTIDISLPGLSENVASATLFYQKGPFETRFSVRYRDAFVSEQVAVNEQTVNFASETVMDWQASYQFTEQLGAVVQVSNLTDEPTRSYFGTESQTGTLQYFGRQLYLGFTYSM